MSDSDLQRWVGRALEMGADRAVAIAPGFVVTADWVRMKCLYGCDGPGFYRCCPPHSPGPADTRRLLDGYRRAILLGMGPFTGYDDSDAHSLRLNDLTTDLEREIFLSGYHEVWSLGAGPCERCAPCVLEGECRHPERARPSMEGCGIDVFTTVRNAEWEIAVVTGHEDQYRFFSLVLID